MRIIYSDIEAHDEDGATYINEATETVVDRIAAALMHGDTNRAYLLANDFYVKAKEEGDKAAKKQMKDWAEDENRRAAEFGHGKAEFRTKDGLICVDKLSLSQNQHYIPVWKRACRVKQVGLMDMNPTAAYEPIEVRTYEFEGERTRNGLPVYNEA